MKFAEGTRVVAAQQQVSCRVGDEATILNLRNGAYYGLNPVGARVWDLIQQPKTVADLRDTLIAEYDVDPARLESDILELVTQLSENKLVEISG